MLLVTGCMLFYLAPRTPHLFYIPNSISLNANSLIFPVFSSIFRQPESVTDTILPSKIPVPDLNLRHLFNMVKRFDIFVP